MNRPLIWLLGAALTIASSPALAGEVEARQQAAANAAGMTDLAGPGDRRTIRRELRVHRMDRPDMLMQPGMDRTEHLATMLQLRPEQKGALSAFLAATGKPAGNPPMHPQQGSGPRTTPERLAEMESHMARQQAAMKTRIEATRTFYARLDERQRKVFDAMPMMMMAGPGFGPQLLPAHHGPHGLEFRGNLPPMPHT